MKKILIAIFLACAAPAAWATVAANNARTEVIALTPGGTQVGFAFKTNSTSHVEVFLDGAKVTTGYSVVLNTNQESSPGGTVTFFSPPALGTRITVQRTVPLAQTSSWASLVASPVASSLTNAFDNLEMQIQQVARDGSGGLGPLPACAAGEYLTTANGGLSCSPDLVGAGGGGGGGLPSDPAACPAGQFATDQNANGVLTCGQVSYSQIIGAPTSWAWASITGAPTTWAWTSITGKPTTFAPSAHTHPVADITATGTRGSTTYLRGDGAWATLPTGSTYTLPAPTTSAMGGVKALSCTNGYILTAIDTSGNPVCTAIGAVLAYIVTTDGNPPADPNQTYWIDASTGGTPTVGAVGFSPPAGTYTSAQTVALSTSTSGAAICYTTNGSTPAATTAGTCSTGVTYTAPFTINAQTTVAALGTKAGYSNSAVQNGTYSFTLPQAAAPTFNPSPGSYSSATTIAVSSATSGATIRCTTDGSTPTGSSTQYTAPIPMLNGTLSCYVASAAGYSPSSATVGSYAIQSAVAAPTFSPQGGTYLSAQTVTVASSTPNVNICYTTDGTDPVRAGGGCSVGTMIASGGTITVGQSMTVKALATNIAAGSSISTATYSITGQAAPPTFSPFNGDIVASTTPISISCSAPSPTIRYTLDGTTPTGSSTVYTEPFNVPFVTGTPTTVKAICQSTGYTDSTVASTIFWNDGRGATPTFSPVAGTYNGTQTVTIASLTPGATICYTTDGSDPTVSAANWANCSNGTQITNGGTATIASSLTLKARATTSAGPGWIVTGAYTINPLAAMPTFSPGAGAVATGTVVTLSCTSPSPTIRYTTDGSVPTGSSTAGTSVTLSSFPTTIKAICQSAGLSDSPVAAASYTQAQAAAPTFSPVAGSVASGTVVTPSSATSGCAAYTRIGTANPPTGADALTYTVTTGVTVYAKVVGCPGYTDSTVSSATYTIASASRAIEGTWQDATTSPASQTGTMSVSVGSGTAGRLLVAVVAHSASNSASTWKATVSGGSLTWTRAGGGTTATMSGAGWVDIWTAVDATGGALTVAAAPNSAGDAPGRTWVASITGATGVRQVTTNNTTGPTLSFVGATASGSIILGGAVNWSSTVIGALGTGDSWFTGTAGTSGYATSDSAAIWVWKRTGDGTAKANNFSAGIVTNAVGAVEIY